jgi:hypothetical protein
MLMLPTCLRLQISGGTQPDTVLYMSGNSKEELLQCKVGMSHRKNVVDRVHNYGHNGSRHTNLGSVFVDMFA